MQNKFGGKIGFKMPDFFAALQKLFCNFCSHHKITHNLHHLLHNVCNSSSDILPFWLAKSNFCHFSKLKSCGPKQFQSNVWRGNFSINMWWFWYSYFRFNTRKLITFRIHFLLLNSSVNFFEILILKKKYKVHKKNSCM